MGMELLDDRARGNVGRLRSELWRVLRPAEAEAMTIVREMLAGEDTALASGLE